LTFPKRDAVADFALKVADHTRSGYTREEFIEWVKGRTRPT